MRKVEGTLNGKSAGNIMREGQGTLNKGSAGILW